MKRVVIIGGGYVGIEAQKKLMKTLGAARERVQVTLINPVDYHAFHGFTGEVLGGLMHLEQTLTDLATLMPRARFLCGTVAQVDLKERQLDVLTESGPQRLAFDHLVVGAGSRDPFERITGLKEYGWCLKDTRDMQRFRAHFFEWLSSLEGLSEGVQQDVVVAGGGPAGVEMAAALNELLRSAAHRPGMARHELRVHLVTGNSGLLRELREQGFGRLAAYAESKLRACGIALIEGTQLSSVNAAGAQLSDGTFIPARFVLVTAGVGREPLPGLQSLYRDGRLDTDDYLRVKGLDNVWTGGDHARVIQPGTTRFCPQNALWAMKHGLCAGDNIARTLLGKPLRPFAFKGLGQSASLGVGAGITELHGVQLTGLMAWIIRLGFFLWYMPDKRKALGLAGHWLKLPWLKRESLRSSRGAAPLTAASGD